MMTNKYLLRALLVGATIGFAPMAAQADVIGFAGPIGTPVAPTVEGAFTYDTYSGGLFRDTNGNPTFDMEGCSACGGGVLRVVLTGGGTFTFDGSDISYEFSGVAPITFEGFLGGVSQGVDSFLTSPGAAWTTHLAVILAGVAIDELRITLDASFNFAEEIDNLRVTSLRIPEPGTLALFGLGLAGLAALRRRRHT